jgi:starch synthase
MNIVFIASEVAPFAKTGGLADVAGALPRYLAELGAAVRVIMPLYRSVRTRASEFGLQEVRPRVEVDWAGGRQTFSIWESRSNGFMVNFIDKSEFFDRDGLYGTSMADYPDNADRFAFFGKACLETLKALGFRADIIHAHDWQSALALAYKKYVYGRDIFFEGTRSLFTIHNLAYQGLFDKSILGRAGLPESLFDMEDLEFYGKVNFLKAGILYSDAVSTVSVRYSREIQTPEFGCGLDGLLRKRSQALFGVLNGVDYEAWNPETDRHLAARFSPQDLRGKTACRQDLLQAYGLSAQGRPVIGMVSRLAGQKGLDILLDGLEALLQTGAVLIILGTGEAAIENALSDSARKHPDQIGLKLAFDDALAHKIYAGSDFFLIPSRYEPCGLTQMYGLKYGTIPIVRATGGLDDTILEFDPRTGQGNGFKFQDCSAGEMVGTIKRALAAQENKNQWRTLRQNAMACDFSWTRSALEYMRLYGRL